MKSLKLFLSLVLKVWLVLVAVLLSVLTLAHIVAGPEPRPTAPSYLELPL